MIEPLTKKSGRVAIMLATYNGEKFLEEQLRSLEQQTHTPIDIWVSDDHSDDRTNEILEQWTRRWTAGEYQLSTGPGRGFSDNFRNLILAVPDGYDGYFFCDQDDVWCHDKIERSLARLKHVSGPAVLGTRTRLIDSTGNEIGLSPLMSRPKTFENALVQSMAGGNTMMLNAEGFRLLRASARRTSFITHDWWTYLIVTGGGGRAFYDPEPSLSYRQHEHNVIGRNTGIAAVQRRATGLLNGRFRQWTEANIAALESCSDMLAPAALDTLNHLKIAHCAPAPTGLPALFASKVYRQTRLGSAALWFACTIGQL